MYTTQCLAITAVPYVRYVRGWSGIENGEAAAKQIVRAAVAAQPATAYVLVTADARSAAAPKSVGPISP